MTSFEKLSAKKYNKALDKFCISFSPLAQLFDRVESYCSFVVISKYDEIVDKKLSLKTLFSYRAIYMSNLLYDAAVKPFDPIYLFT